MFRCLVPPGIYLFAEVSVKFRLFAIGIAAECDMIFILFSADHIVHLALIGKLIIIFKDQIRGRDFTFVQLESEGRDLLPIALKAVYIFCCFMSRLKKFGTENNIAAPGLEKKQYKQRYDNNVLQSNSKPQVY